VVHPTSCTVGTVSLSGGDLVLTIHPYLGPRLKKG